MDQLAKKEVHLKTLIAETLEQIGHFDEELFDMLTIDTYHQQVRLDCVLRNIVDLQTTSHFEAKEIKETNKYICKDEVELKEVQDEHSKHLEE